jgi:hypothetical protein
MSPTRAADLRPGAPLARIALRAAVGACALVLSLLVPGCLPRLDVPTDLAAAEMTVRLLTQRSEGTAVTWRGSWQRAVGGVPTIPGADRELGPVSLVIPPGALEGTFDRVEGLDPGVWQFYVEIGQPDGTTAPEIPCDEVLLSGAAVISGWTAGGEVQGDLISEAQMVVVEGGPICTMTGGVDAIERDLEVVAVDCLNCAVADAAVPGDQLELEVRVRNLGGTLEWASVTPHAVSGVGGALDAIAAPRDLQRTPGARALDPEADAVAVATVDQIPVAPDGGEASAFFLWDTSTLAGATHCISFEVGELLGESAPPQGDCRVGDNRSGGNRFAKELSFTIRHDVRVTSVCASSLGGYGAIPTSFPLSSVAVTVANAGAVDEVLRLDVDPAAQPFLAASVVPNIYVPRGASETRSFVLDPTGSSPLACDAPDGSNCLDLGFSVSYQQPPPNDNDDPSDNQLTLSIPLYFDLDGDYIANPADSCWSAWTLNQLDDDGDGFANRCDPDFDQNGVIEQRDADILQCALDVAAATGQPAPRLFDWNGDGTVTLEDRNDLTSHFGEAMGTGSWVTGLDCADPTAQTQGAWAGPPATGAPASCAGLTGVTGGQVPCLPSLLPACVP